MGAHIQPPFLLPLAFVGVRFFRAFSFCMINTLQSYGEEEEEPRRGRENRSDKALATVSFSQRPGETMCVYLAELGWSFTLGLGLLFESKNSKSQRAAEETQQRRRAVGFVAELCCWSVMGQDV